MTMVPTSTGIGAPGTAPAPASLQRSPMAAAPAASGPQQIPFVRGSSLATMQDFSAVGAAQGLIAGGTYQFQLQTNAFLEELILDISLTTAGNAATVAFAADSPWQIFSSIYLNDPANQAIIAPISGYGLYLMNKYLVDSGCDFDPQRDPAFVLTTGGVGTGGSFSMRLVVPIEHRKRDALGAVNNSAANQRYLLGIQMIASFATLYTTAPTTPATFVNVVATQVYWTMPPAQIATAGGATQVQPTPSGLGTVCFVRYERHNEVSGGGSPQIQLNNVGDYISGLVFVLRTSANVRDPADWPSPFAWWVNDFQVHNLTVNVWQRDMARFYQLWSATGSAGGIDSGVYVMHFLNSLFDTSANFGPASQYLPTDATTKLQIRGSTFGGGAGYLEIYTRTVRPVSGAALFA